MSKKGPTVLRNARVFMVIPEELKTGFFELLGGESTQILFGYYYLFKILKILVDNNYPVEAKIFGVHVGKRVLPHRDSGILRKKHNHRTRHSERTPKKPILHQLV